MRFFHSARLRTMPARMVCSSHSRRIAGDGGVHGSGLNNSVYSRIRAASTEVTDLCRIDDADDVTRIVQCQRHAEAVTAGRLHADMGLFAAHGLEPGSHQLPAIGTVCEDPALFPLAFCTVGVQGLLGHVDSDYGITHFCYHYS